MSKITGLGGVFLKSADDDKELLKWYRDVLELDVSEFGINFLEPNLITLITFSKKGENEAVLNLAVDDLDGFLQKLKGKGVQIYKETQSYPFGAFAQIKDPSGNVVELCQINREEYKKMTQKEIEEFKN